METAFTEICTFIELLGDDYKEKIPKELYSYFEKNKDKSFKVSFDKNTPIEDIKMSREATLILSMLHLKFWANIEEQTYLKNIYASNEQKYQESINYYKDSNWLNQNNTNDKINIKLENYAETTESENIISKKEFKNNINNIKNNKNKPYEDKNELKTNWVVSYQEQFTIFDKIKNFILKLLGKYHF